MSVGAPAALYIHVPFCFSVCPYCDFVVYGGSAARGPTNKIAGTVDALVTEITLRAPNQPTRPLRSVYLGGGTPSLLSAVQVERLLEAAAASYGIAPDAEITLECNPGPADRGDLRGFRAAGVNRLSVGAQSLDAAELRRLGRRHEPNDVAATVDQARAASFDNISLDLLYDVPDQSLGSWRATLEAALALEPEHLSAYALTLDTGDAFGDDHLPISGGALRWRQRATEVQDDDLAADCYALADDLLSAAGYGWYEISNWARSGAQSRHNLVYWTGEAYEAVGPGAHAFDGVATRRWNAARLDAYLGALSAGQLPPSAFETVDPPTAATERLILKLRTAAGTGITPPPTPSVNAAFAWARASGLLEGTETDGVRLTLTGRLLSNELFLRLMAYPGNA